MNRDVNAAQSLGQGKRRRGVRAEAKSSEALQAPSVTDLGVRRPKQDKGRTRPNLEDVGTGGASVEDVGSDATTVYSKMTDEDGREYTLLICSCRKCAPSFGQAKLEST